jgi:hypothetical protein
LDFARLRNGEIVAAVGGLALFIFMFFDWFGGGVEVSTGGTQDIPGVGEVTNAPSVEETGLSAWDALQDFSGFLIALAAVSGVTLAGLAAAGQRLNLPFRRGVGTLVLGNLAVLLILWRMLANPGELEIGIFLGLFAAAAIAVGAWIALHEDGFEPLVKVPGEQTTTTAATAAASAPAATPSPRPATAQSGGSGPSGPGSSGTTTAKSRSGGSKTTKSRSSGSKATKSRSGGRKATKSRSSGSKSAGKKSTSKGTAKKTTAKKGTTKSSGSSRSKSKAKPKSGGKRRSSGKRKQRKPATSGE